MDSSEIIVIAGAAAAVIFVIWYFFPRNKSAGREGNQPMTEQPETRSVQLQVSGMTCRNCVRHVSRTLDGLDGVMETEVDLEGARATVRIRSGAVRPAELAAAVQEAGYEALLMED